VREIQPGHVHALKHQCRQLFFWTGGGSDRANDLGPAPGVRLNRRACNSMVQSWSRFLNRKKARP